MPIEIHEEWIDVRCPNPKCINKEGEGRWLCAISKWINQTEVRVKCGSCHHEYVIEVSHNKKTTLSHLLPR